MRRVLCALALLGACSREPSRTSEAAPPKPAASAPKAAPVVSLFDAEGKLKPSGKSIAWFELPVGFEEAPASRPRHHVYLGRGMTLQHVRDYLGARTLSGEVEERAETVQYRNVMPPSAASDAQHFDVTLAVREEGAVIRLMLDERNFLFSNPKTPQELKEQYKKEQARAE